MSETPKIGCLIATPVRHFNGWQGYHKKFKELLNRLTELSSDPACPYEFWFLTGEGGLCKTRIRMAHEFKRIAKENPSVKWLLTLDDDLEWTGEDPAEPILRLLSHKRPLVAAMYTTREEYCHWAVNFMHEVELQKGGLLQVIEMSAGMKLTHIKVFTELERIYPNITYTDRDSGERITAYYQQCVLQTDLKPDGDLLSEDYYMDHLCRMAKIGLFVDTTIKLRHRDSDGTRYPLNDKWPAIPIDGPEVVA